MIVVCVNMNKNINVISNFPDILTLGVEYKIKFTFLVKEKKHVIIKYCCSDNLAVKRMSVIKEEKFLANNDNTEVKLIFIKSGTNSFYITINDEIVYQKTFIVDNNFKYSFIEDMQQPKWFCYPYGTHLYTDGKDFTFNYNNVTQQDWLQLYKKQKLKNNKIYCGIKYIAPIKSTHWRIITKSNNAIQDSKIIEFMLEDENIIEWYFPSAIIINNQIKIIKKDYIQNIYFYYKYYNEYIELSHNTYIIHI